MQLLLVMGVLSAAVTYRSLQGVEPAAAETSCDLSLQDCDVPLGEQRLQLHLQTRPLQAGQPVQVSLSTTDSGWIPHRAELQGHSMYMGRLPLSLMAVSDRRWQGWLQVPACTHELMIWQLDIEWHRDAQRAQSRVLVSVRHHDAHPEGAAAPRAAPPAASSVGNP